MRTYTRNSPQAAARIVALVLTSDGHVCSSEDRALERLDIMGELGLAPKEFAQIVQSLCEDQSITHTPFALSVGNVDATMLATLMDEIDDPALRRKVIRLCLAVAVADDYLADGEIALLAAVLNAWAPTLSLASKSRGNPPRGHDRAAAIT